MIAQLGGLQLINPLGKAFSKGIFPLLVALGIGLYFVISFVVEEHHHIGKRSTTPLFSDFSLYLCLCIHDITT